MSTVFETIGSSVQTKTSLGYKGIGKEICKYVYGVAAGAEAPREMCDGGSEVI